MLDDLISQLYIYIYMIFYCINSYRSHIATKSFMAIRIFVNNELNELYEGMKMVENYMAQGKPIF